jgi:hypothetical protein
MKVEVVEDVWISRKVVDRTSLFLVLTVLYLFLKSVFCLKTLLCLRKRDNFFLL